MANTHAATTANLKRAQSRLDGELYCRCCHVGKIALKEAERCVERVREIERIEAVIEAEADDA